MNEPKKMKFRWWHLRLRFLLIAIPVGGLIIGMILGETQRLDREIEYRRDLANWHPNTDDATQIRERLSRFIARGVRLHELSVDDLLTTAYVLGDTLWLSPMIFDDRQPWCFAVRIDADHRMVGAVSLRDDWKVGTAPELDPEVLRVHGILENISPSANKSVAVAALIRAGYKIEKPIDPSVASFVVGSIFSVVLTDRFLTPVGSKQGPGPVIGWNWGIYWRNDAWKQLEQFLYPMSGFQLPEEKWQRWR